MNFFGLMFLICLIVLCIKLIVWASCTSWIILAGLTVLFLILGTLVESC